jgi:hypothetical protein
VQKRIGHLLKDQLIELDLLAVNIHVDLLALFLCDDPHGPVEVAGIGAPAVKRAAATGEGDCDSPMPAGQLKPWSDQQVRDLFADLRATLPLP